jgi:hypothetical protein
VDLCLAATVHGFEAMIPHSPSSFVPPFLQNYHSWICYIYIFTYPMFLVFVSFGFVKTLECWALCHFLCKVLLPFCFCLPILTKDCHLVTMQRTHFKSDMMICTKSKINVRNSFLFIYFHFCALYSWPFVDLPGVPQCQHNIPVKGCLCTWNRIFLGS